MAYKQITVLGASSGLGLEVTHMALQNRHPVVAVARSTGALPQHENLTIVAGDARDKDVLKRAIKGSQSIIFTLGHGQNMEPTTALSESMQALLEVIADSAEKPFISCMIGYGGGDSYRFITDPLFKSYFDSILEPVYRDKAIVEKLLKRYEGGWMMAYPGKITNGPLTRFYVIEELAAGVAAGEISQSDMAHFMLVQAENNVLDHKQIVTRNPG